MEPYRYLQEVSRHLDQMHDSEALNRTLDEVEYLYDALDPEFQDLADDLIQRLHQRLSQARELNPNA